MFNNCNDFGNHRQLGENTLPGQLFRKPCFTITLDSWNSASAMTLRNLANIITMESSAISVNHSALTMSLETLPVKLFCKPCFTIALHSENPVSTPILETCLYNETMSPVCTIILEVISVQWIWKALPIPWNIALFHDNDSRSPAWTTFLENLLYNSSGFLKSCHFQWLSDGILEQTMAARNWVGIGLSYWPARLRRLAESIPVLLKNSISGKHW